MSATVHLRTYRPRCFALLAPVLAIVLAAVPAGATPLATTGEDSLAPRVAIAARHAGVNNNLLAPGTLVDVPSGNAIVNGIPVPVTAA